MLAYCEMFGIKDIESREVMMQRIRALDSSLMKVMRDKAERSRAAKK